MLAAAVAAALEAQLLDLADLALEAQLLDLADLALEAQLPVLAHLVVEAQLPVLVRLKAAAVVLRAVLAVEVVPEQLLRLSRRSFSAAMARSTP